MYVDRVVDAELAARLRSAGAVVIEGPKACGKTETARRAVASEVLFDVDDVAREAVKVDPKLVLDGPRPRLLDEWQEAPVLWNHVRRAVDDAGAPGQFVLTGSSTPADDPVRHSGAGRFSFLRMRPMSLYESGHSDGSVSLKALMSGEAPGGRTDAPEVTDLVDWVVRGGWPGRQLGSVADAAQGARDYLHQIAQVDISRVDGVARDPRRVTRVLASLGRNVSTEARNTVIAADAGLDGQPLDPHSVASYLDALERLLVLDEQPAWTPRLRSRARLRTSAKRHLACPSLAAAAVGATPASLVRDLEYLGLLVESLTIRDLRVLSQPLEGTVRHYRDSNGLEIDAIVEVAGGAWGAFEVKLGFGQVDDAAASLLRFADTVETAQVGKPAVLAVICGRTEYAYRREDGVTVVPLASLGP